jgi:ubiquinone/menaquinone biosynthesis C-methylase UbiE
MAEISEYWNHNVHYQQVILGAVPARCRTALDVGCGDGLLAGRLAAHCVTVTGIDSDAPMISKARDRASAMGAANVTFIEADFMAYPLEDASLDFACANTALHHMDFGAGLGKMARLLRPGGTLAVVGLGDAGSPADFLIDAAGIPAHMYYKRTRGGGNPGPGAPVKDPGMTWAQARDTARRVLPGVRYRRHLLWRYSLVWTKPA